MDSAEFLRAPRSAAPARVLRLRLPPVTVEAALFIALAALYITIGAILVFGFHSIAGDALSRVANAYYVLYSRDPHLAAMGFIWSPLPSMLVIPFLPLMVIWSPLVSEGFITNVWSAVFMAGAALQLYRLCGDLGLPRAMSLACVALFALHPYVMQYGANGMSEAMFLFFVIAATRQLARWIEHRTTVSLVLAGIWVGASYLVRYEAAPIAAASSLVVLGLTYRQTVGSRSQRTIAGVADAAIYAAPFAAMFMLWAAASWLIVGSPFAQFTSAYGITSQLEADRVILEGTGQGSAAAITFTVAQIMSLEPVIVPLVALGVGAAVARRDVRILAPLAIYGAVVAFTLWAWLTGRTGGWLRYYIVLIPLAATMAAWALTGFAAAWGRHGSWSWIERLGRVARPAARWTATVGALAVILLGLIALPEGATTLARYDTKQPEGRINDARQYLNGREVALFVDGLDPGHESVLVDAFMGFPVILSSDEPRQFVITPDRDFEDVLADPWAAGIRYLLVPPNHIGWGEIDRLNREWPDLYDNGAGIATLVREFPTVADRYVWRLYELNPSQ